MKIYNAQLRDVLAVLEEPSEVTVAEAGRAELTPWTLLKAARTAMQTGDAFAVHDDEGLLFVLGSNRHRERKDVRQLWFVATQRYFDKGAAGVRMGRQFMRFLRNRHSGATLESTSWSQHPSLARWFGLLGFRLTGYTGLNAVFRTVASKSGKLIQA